MALIAALNTLSVLAIMGLFLALFTDGRKALSVLLQLHQVYSLLGTLSLTGLFLGFYWCYRKLFFWWIKRYETKTLKFES